MYSITATQFNELMKNRSFSVPFFPTSDNREIEKQPEATQKKEQRVCSETETFCCVQIHYVLCSLET